MLPRLIARQLEAIMAHGKMAFLSGPRQVGKTTLARQVQKTLALTTAISAISVSW